MTINKKISYEILKKFLDYSPNEIYVIDAHGIVCYANRAVEAHCGIKCSELIGKNNTEISLANYWYPRLSPRVLKEKIPMTLEQYTKTGRTLLTTAIPIFDSNGNIEYIIENSRDITENKKITSDLTKANKLIDRYKKELEALRNYSGNIPSVFSYSERMMKLIPTIHKIAKTNSTVLILGESGTGKSHMANYIHKNSPQPDGPFVSINCASIPDELMESELFGYARGAFTGANSKGNSGLIELANGGTLFLDEIGELSLKLQAKLLQVLQDKTYYKVGGRTLQHMNCRIIAATNRDIYKMIQDKLFREDLYYRLNVFEVELPPLRDRREEIISMALYFLKQFNNKYGRNRKFSDKILNFFLKYSWPGNVRELSNIIERAVVINKGTTIDDIDLPMSDSTVDKDDLKKTQDNYFTEDFFCGSLQETLDYVEKKIIISAYEETKSSYKTALKLKISQSKASRLIKKYCTNNK